MKMLSTYDYYKLMAFFFLSCVGLTNPAADLYRTVI